MSDIVHEENGKWYFWDETWVDRYGPYATEQEATKMWKKYCERYLQE